MLLCLEALSASPRHPETSLPLFGSRPTRGGATLALMARRLRLPLLQPSVVPLLLSSMCSASFGGSREVANECAALGLRVSPVIDLQVSCEYDLHSPVVLEWILHLFWRYKVGAVVIALGSGTRSCKSERKAGSSLKASRLAERCIAIFKLAARAGASAFLFAKKGAGTFALPAASGLLAAEGVHFIPPCSRDSGPCSGPGLLFSQRPVGPDFVASRSVPGLSSKAVARCICDLRAWAPPDVPSCSPGLESLATNEALLSLDWEVGLVWRWQRERHINALETESAVSLLRSLAREGRDQRPVMILDSSCARGALAKGRSSAKLLRPSLRKAGALCVAGGLFPAYTFGPTRLNVSDDPTRAAPLREACRPSFLSLCHSSDLPSVCQLKGASKNRADSACAPTFCPRSWSLCNCLSTAPVPRPGLPASAPKWTLRPEAPRRASRRGFRC